MPLQMLMSDEDDATGGSMVSMYLLMFDCATATADDGFIMPRHHAAVCHH